MSGRPLGYPELWATDATYSAPSKAWDGQPTKVAPGAGRFATGWAPGERPPADFWNYLENQKSAFLRFLSDIQVQNWLLADVSGLTMGDVIVPCYGGHRGSGNSSYNLEGYLVYQYANTQSLVVYHDGSARQCAATTRSHKVRVCHPHTEAILAVCDQTTGAAELSGNGGFSWSNVDALNADGTAQLGLFSRAYDAAFGSYLIFGVNASSSDPEMSAYDVSGTRIDLITPVATGAAGALYDVAGNGPDGSDIMLAGNDTYWFSSNGDGNAPIFTEYAAASPWGVNSFPNLDWSEECGWVALWYPFASIGIMRFATSQDGTTWTPYTEVALPDSAGDRPNFDVTTRKPFFRIIGGTWVVCLTNDNSKGEKIAYSTDAGVTWNYIGSNITGGLTIARISNGFALLSGTTGVRTSLRLGPQENRFAF